VIKDRARVDKSDGAPAATLSTMPRKPEVQHMRKPRSLAVAVLAAAALLAGAQPALASPKNASVLSDDASPGGKASFVVDGLYSHRLTACDLQKDGYAAVAYASFHKFSRRNPGTHQNRVVDLNSKRGCAHGSIGISSPNLGRRVYVTVCLYRKTTGHRFCDTNVGRT
jgi:hypothetical protein